MESKSKNHIKMIFIKSLFSRKGNAILYSVQFYIFCVIWFTLKPPIFSIFWTLRYSPEIMKHDVTKRHLLKCFLRFFSAVLMKDVKLILDDVLNVSRRYLSSLWAIEKILEGAESANSGARVNVVFILGLHRWIYSGSHLLPYLSKTVFQNRYLCTKYLTESVLNLIQHTLTEPNLTIFIHT